MIGLLEYVLGFVISFLVALFILYLTMCVITLRGPFGFSSETDMFIRFISVILAFFGSIMQATGEWDVSISELVENWNKDD